MAKIGLKYPVYSGSNGGAVLAKAIQADITIEPNDEALYADDGIAETDKSFRTGTITVGIDDLSDTAQVDILGHSLSDGEVTANSGDEPPIVRFGFYGVKKVNDVKKYRAIWLPRVQFAEPADSNATKGDTTVFNTPVVTGTIMTDDNGNWKQEQTFDNEGDARAYLGDKAGIPGQNSGGLTGLAMTGTGGTLSPSFGTAVRFYSYDGLTGNQVAVTPTAAGHSIKLYVDGAPAQTLTSGAASAQIPITTAGTKKLTIVAQEPGKRSQTTEIVVIKIS